MIIFILDNNMRAQEFTEASKDYWERLTAANQIGDIMSKYETWAAVSDEDFKQIKLLVNTSGRATEVRGEDRKHYGSAGSVVDRIAQAKLDSSKKSGALPAFRSVSPTAESMARQIAAHTNGYYHWKNPNVWTRVDGTRYKDPADYVEYNSEEDYEDAMGWLDGKGKKIHYKNQYGDLVTAIQIGRYLISPATTVRGVFSKDPETIYQVSVRTTGALGNLRVKQDITDQQAAALQDIANTKSANVMDSFRKLMSWFKSEQALKAVIDNTKKITPADKAKLDAIIAGAKNFKEPPGY
jgi:hypothetical protein